MGAHPLIFAAVLLYSVQLGYSVPPTISFVPPSPLILTSNETQPGTGRPLAITCTQVAGGTLLTLNLYKLTTAGIRNPLMNAALGGTADGTNGIAQTAPGVTGATASGTLDQRFITLTYSQASCDSGATYICASNVLVAGDSNKMDVSFNYSVDVNPGHATLIIEGAASGSTYMVGDSAILRCNADVGAVDGNTKVDFVWQYEVQNTFGGKTFQDYPNLEDIDNKASPTYNQYCTKSQNRISVLTRNLTIEDSERQYKCYIRKGSQSYEQFAGVKAFSVVQDAGSTQSTRTNSQGSTQSTRANSQDASPSPAVTVGVITALAVVLFLVVVTNVAFVIWLWKRHWHLPCAEKSAAPPETHITDRSANGSLHENSARELPKPAAGNDALYPVLSTHPYDSLHMSDVGQRSPYADLASQQAAREGQNLESEYQYVT